VGMKLLVDGIIYQDLSHGGIPRLYTEILPRMCEMDNSLRVELLTSGRLARALPVHPSIHHRSLPAVDRLLRPQRLWGPIVWQIREQIQHMSMGSAGEGIWHSTYYTMPGKWWDGPAVVTVFDMIHERFAQFFRGSSSDQFRERKRRCVLTADAVICISKATQQDVLQFYRIDAARTQIVPLAVDKCFRVLNNAHCSSRSATQWPFLLYVGGRFHYKNFRLVLQAYNRWPQRKEVDLVVVGLPWSREERKYLDELGIRARIHLMKDVDDEGLCLLYNHAIGFVYPSLYEGFGIPLLESMACGCPVIASRIPSTVEVSGGCPIYFNPSEEEGLLAAFDIALSEGRDSERVKLGLDRVRQYSWDKAAMQTLEVYRALSNSV
jgi:glycosyltransferase involved in cell wall biosynthesis